MHYYDALLQKVYMEFICYSRRVFVEMHLNIGYKQ